MSSLPMCGSKRIIDNETVECNRRYGHPSTQKHRAILEDFTLLLWEGEDSRTLQPRMADAEH